MKFFLRTYCFSLLFLLQLQSKAQLSGIYTVPGSYASLNSAIIALNTQGISGPVTINIAANYTETVPFGGYALTATGTSVNPITFQKNGAGANPQLIAYTGGTATPFSAVQDGIWSFIGSDYITVDGIDLTDPNTSNPSTMEYGFSMFMSSLTNGCQHNTIKNCVITLNKINNTAGISTSADGSRGIDIICAFSNLNGTAQTATSFSGHNSFNKIYSNTIQNCNNGIVLYGSSTSTVGSQSNDIGGNSSATGNTIINYGGAPGATCPAMGVKVFYQWDANIAYNVLNNNNGAGSNHVYTLRGIYMNNHGVANVSVTNNTVSIKGGGTNTQVSAIENWCILAPYTGTININQNVVTNCSYLTTTTGSFYGICNATQADVVNINNNSFINIAGGTLNPLFHCINNYGAVHTALNINGNSINGLSANNVSSSTFFRPISSTGTYSSMVLSISNNSIQAVSLTGTVQFTEFSFIYNTASVTATSIDNNTAINLSMANSGDMYIIKNSGTTPFVTANGNSITGTLSKTLSGGGIFGYCFSGVAPTSGTTSISNNNFSNISVTGTVAITGISVSNGSLQAATVNSNTITNLSGSSVGIDGIVMNTLAGNSISNNLLSNYSGNFIHGIYVGGGPGQGLSIASNTMSNYSATQSAYGIYSQLTNSVSVYKNRIGDIPASATNGVVMGIQLFNPKNLVSVVNNLVGDLRTPSASGLDMIRGISVEPATNSSTLNVFYNTVNLNAVSSGTLFGTSAFYFSGDPNPAFGLLKLNNNIFINASTRVGSAYTVAFRRGGPVVIANYDVGSNANMFYAGTPGPSNLIHLTTTVYSTLANFKSLVTPADAASVTESAVFTSTVDTNPNFLKLSTSIPTQAESGAISIVSVNDDNGGTTRNASTPDMGAWEDNYLAIDQSAPSQVGLMKTNGSCNFTGFTFTVNLIDATGVAGGPLAPRCYYKINSGAYTSVQGTMLSGTPNNGVWLFAPAYTAIPGDILYYYVATQDIASTPNIGSMPNIGFVASNVNSVTSPPASTYSFTIIGVLNGTYTVGSGGNFPTITSAAAAYNTWCITGPVTFLLTDPSYSSSEIFPIKFLKNKDASPTNSLLIRPNLAVSVLVSTNSGTNGAIFKFLDANYISVDGINSGGSSLTLNNIFTGTEVWLATSTLTTAGNKKIGFYNTTFRGGSNIAAGNWGIVSGIDQPSWPTASGGIDNDSITIQNNFFYSSYNPIFAGGSASVSAGACDAWLIDQNIIGPTISGADNIGGVGIWMSNCVGFTVSNNRIQYIKTASANISGMNFEQNVNLFTVSQNTITNLSCSVMTNSTTALCAMNLGFNVQNSLFEKNNISSISNYTSTSGTYNIRGMTIRTNSASNLQFRNNMIADIYSGGGSTAPFWPIGISVEGVSGGIDFDNNTIGLTGTSSSLGALGCSAALYFDPTVTNIKMRNNILSNAYYYSLMSTSRCYDVYSAAPSSAFTAMDYNDYYVGGPSSSLILAYVNSANQTNLGAIQSSFGNNTNSKNIAPVFTSNYDLHLPSTSNITLDNLGAVLPGVTTDIDNQARSVTNPDMGADEFSTAPCTVVSPATQSVNLIGACNGQTLAVTASSGSGVGYTYQWMVSPTPGGPYFSVTGGIGATTISYSTGILTTGTYYYVMETTCTSSSLSAISNEATVSIAPAPTASITSNAPICEGQTLNLFGGTDIGSSFLWKGPASFITPAINPSIINASVSASGTYTFISTDGNCSTSVTASIMVNANPGPVIVTSNTLSCTGASVTLTASGASTYVWNPGGAGNPIVINPTVTTTYSVVGTSAGTCTGTAVYIQNVSTCTEITEINNSQGINIYPNPNTGVFYIETENINLNDTLTIENVLGQKMAIVKNLPAKCEINISGVASGIYYLTMRRGNQTVLVTKIIKE